ncbi:MAG TPA: PQQ-binding-like beta-propeller repeat protein, partial [Clostridia bacterium]|nr:PQQ-binding-like beta-propeller repeat protein [Clostridia bacterium]
LSPGGTVVHLTWTTASDAETYEIWRSTNSNRTAAELLATNTSSVVGFDDAYTRAGISYHYWVRAVNTVGLGDFSEPATATQTNQLWALPPWHSCPVVSTNGTVYAIQLWGSGNDRHGRVNAYDPEGTVLWSYADAELLSSAPVLTANGLLVCPSSSQGGSLVALTTSGQLAWSVRVGRLGMSALAADPYGTVYALGDSISPRQDFYAVTADGSPFWSKSLGGNSADHAVIGQDGRVYVGVNMCLDAFSQNGQELWYMAYPSAPGRWGTPALNAQGELVLGHRYANVPAFMRIQPDGATVVSNRLRGVSWLTQYEPVISRSGDSYAIIGPRLYCFDTNGVIQWTNQFQTGWEAAGPCVPALDNMGNIYVADSKNLVIVDRNGLTVDRIELSSFPIAPPILTPDGHLYLVCEGKLCALRARAGLDTQAPWPLYRHDPAGTACQPGPLARPSKPLLLAPQQIGGTLRILRSPTLAPAALELFRSATSNFQDAVSIGASSLGSLFVDDTNACPGVVYYYWARLHNAGGTSEMSDPVQAVAVDLPVKWFVQLPDLPAAPPAISPDGTIYTCATNRLLAFNPDGSLRWQIPGLRGTPIVSPDATVIIRSDASLFSLSSSGTTNWTLDGFGSVAGQVPAIGTDGRIIVNQTNDDLVAYAGDGSLVWRIQHEGHTLSAASVGGDGSIILLQDGRTLLRLLPSGDEAFSAPLTDTFYSASAPTVDADGVVYLGGSSWSAVSAIRSNGSNQWQLAGGIAKAPPIIGMDGTAFAGFPVRTYSGPTSYTEQIAAILPDGSLRWSVLTDTNTQAYLALAANGILYANAGTNLLALAADDGHLIWELPSPNGRAYGPPVLDYDGTLYLPVAGGLLALRLDSPLAPSAWPMHRQNPRQSACVQRSGTPQLQIRFGHEGQPVLERLAPGSCILLKSLDLRTWEKVSFQPPGSPATSWPIETSPQSAAFYRLIAP